MNNSADTWSFREPHMIVSVMCSFFHKISHCIHNSSTQKVQTSANAIRIGCLSDLSQNVVDALHCWYQVISPSMVQIGRWLHQKYWQMSRIPYFTFSKKKNEKVIPNPCTDPDHHQKLITSRGSPHCPCLPSLVDVHFLISQLSCLQNDSDCDQVTWAWLAEV